MTDRMIIKCNALAKTVDRMQEIIEAYGWSGSLDEELKLQHICDSLHGHLADTISKEYTIVTLMLYASKLRKVDPEFVNVLNAEAVALIEAVRESVRR